MTPGNSERLSDCFGGCDPSTLARDFGTPLLVLDEACIRSRMRRFREAFAARSGPAGSTVTYAGKALLVAAIAAIAHEERLLVDVCSLGELLTALRAGVPAQRCVLHGCYKTDEELDAAARCGVGLVVIDHLAEIEALGQRATDAGSDLDVLIRINPSIAADTHELVRTSAASSKFGFSIDDGQAMSAVVAVTQRSGLRLAGLHCHLGSSLYDLEAYSAAVGVLVAFAESCKGVGQLDIFDVGGGLAVGDRGDRPEPTPERWADAIFSALERRCTAAGLRVPRVFVEPGRALIAAAGTTLYRVGVRKRLANGREALIVDGGLSDNPRPALYDAEYQVFMASRPEAEPTGSFTVFGRHCETDRLFPDVALADPQPGDLLAVRDTGAYTYAMASNYNRFPRPAVVLVGDAQARVVARREDVDHVLDLDVFERS